MVRLDHSFRIERSKQDTADRNMRNLMIAEGHLTPEAAAQLASLLKDPDLASALPAHSQTRVTLFRSRFRFVIADIPRDKYHTQTFSGVAVEDEKTDPAVKVLVSFMESVEASDVSPLRDARPNGCAPPRAKAPLQ